MFHRRPVRMVGLCLFMLQLLEKLNGVTQAPEREGVRERHRSADLLVRRSAGRHETVACGA